MSHLKEFGKTIQVKLQLIKVIIFYTFFRYHTYQVNMQKKLLTQPLVFWYVLHIYLSLCSLYNCDVYTKWVSVLNYTVWWESFIIPKL